MIELYLSIIGTSISIIVGLYELNNHVYPIFQRKCPELFGINQTYNEEILQKLRIEQCYKTQWYGLRTIVGLYQDIIPFLSMNNHKIGCCCCKRKLNLQEFYDIIENSFEWRKMREFEIKDQKTKQDILHRIDLIDNNISDVLKKDISSYYWKLNKPQND